MFGNPPRHADARAEDAPAMAALHRGAFPRGWSAAEIASLLTDPGGVGRAVWRGDSLAGFILGRVAADEAEVLSLVVAKSARRRGLGAALLSALEESCRSAGAVSMFLEVAEANIAAQALYHRAGYFQIGRRPAYYEDRSPALTLRKNL
jgi:ribosomal-protein-alanine N-acetyltransferase